MRLSYLFSVLCVFEVKYVKQKSLSVFLRVTGMPKEKYDPPDPRRCYTIMSAEEAASGKKAHWAELEISGQFKQLIVFLLPLSHNATDNKIQNPGRKNKDDGTQSGT